ncbi:hypothetical protein [Mucilaginibacter koreensis]
MLKRIIIFCFIAFCTINVYSQNITELESAGTGAKLQADEAIIYGNFVQKLSYWKSGYQQYIFIRNLDTHAIYCFQVKSKLGGAKMRLFCYHIPLGNYEILNYYYSKATWYGNTQGFNSPVFKNIDIDVNVKNKLDSGLIKREDLHRFTFSAAGNTLVYLGTWHFDTGIISFTNNKAEADQKLQPEYTYLIFKEALINIPD